MEEKKEISQELLNKVAALKAITTTYNLLQEGCFQAAAHQALHSSMQFIISLHKQVSDEALDHPEADLIPELVALKGVKSE